MTASLLPKTWRYRIFGVTWLSYAGFYLCRKNFSVVMPMLTDEFGFTKVDLALILIGYSLIYMRGVHNYTIRSKALFNSMLATVSSSLFVVDSRFEHGRNLPYGAP